MNLSTRYSTLGSDYLILRVLGEARTLSPEALLSFARKAVESDHPGERAVFAEKLKSMGHDPHEIIRRSQGQNTRPRGQSTGPRPTPPGREPTPAWAWAGYSGGYPPSHGIYTNSYRDLNFIKKRMWELSGKSKKEHTIHQFDGGFFRHTYTAYGHEKIYPEMAKAMLEWGSGANPYHTKAIFASTGKSNKLRLIWANGVHVTPHIEVEHSSPNLNPANDHHFTRGLSDWIDSQVPVK